MAVAHTSKIEFKIGLDENKVPEKINWRAEDGGVQGEETKAVLLSVWDPKKKDTLRIDLWTKDMPVDEMKQFFHQTFTKNTKINGFSSNFTKRYHRVFVIVAVQS